MNFIRVFENPHRSQQRLGFLKYLTWQLSKTDTSSIEALGKDLLGVVSKKIKIEVSKELEKYVQKRIRGTKIPEGKGSIQIELQDVYLSQNSLPSKTGKLYFDNWRRYPYFLSSAGIMKKDTCSLLVRGKVFLELVSKEELDAFLNYNNHVNPFVLSDEQKYLLLYSLIEGDGDVLKRLYIDLLSKSGVFSDWDAGDLMPSIYRKIVRDYESRTRSGMDKERIGQLERSAKRIEGWKNMSNKGGGAKADSITVRLEPFVDLGLLEKPNPYGYKYFINKAGARFFKTFCKSDTNHFLNFLFFKSLNKSYELRAIPLKRHGDIIKGIYHAYMQLKSPLGYAPIKEVALLSAIKSVVQEKRYFEIEKAKSLIMNYQKRYPDLIRFQVDRSGAPVYVKFIKRLEDVRGFNK